MAAIRQRNPANPTQWLYDPNGGGATFVSPGGVDEVWIGTSPPTDPNVELWFNPEATP